MAVERLSPAQWQKLERELKRGPLSHGLDDEDQGWTLKRAKLLIGRLFHVGYTIQGVSRLLRAMAGAAMCRSVGRWNGTRRRSRYGRPRCGRG